MTTKTFPVLTICGSMSYYQNMLVFGAAMTCKGWIVLLPLVVKGRDGDPKMLDEMHLEKISMSDAIYVVSDHTGYIGDSTKREIEYAKSLNIPVHYAKVGCVL